MGAANDGHFRQKHTDKGEITKEVQSPCGPGWWIRKELGLSWGRRMCTGCALLSEQGERVQNQGLGQAAVKGQEEVSL